MSKLKIFHKNNQIYIKSKLDRKEEVSERELQVFSKKVIRGLMRPAVDGRKKISYSAPEGISLKQYLQRGISREEFFIALAQVVEVTKRISKYRLNFNNLVLNLQYTFINERTREIYFIYQPIVNQNMNASILIYIQDMAFNANFYLCEDTRFINELADYMQNMLAYEAEEMEQYIVRVCPEAYRNIQREGQSRMLNGKKWDVSKNDSGYGAEGTSLLDEEDTTLLEEEGTTLLEEGTTLLEEEGTTLLGYEMPSYPYLIRTSNCDKVDINKPIFRIGKERKHVDYFVANNNAVSRLHADIIKRGDTYYLRDNNSTNHTFVNGVIVAGNEEKRLYDGDALMLANEAFEFYIP